MNHIRYVLFFTVALSAFGIGVFVNRISSEYRPEPPAMLSAESLRQDELHRLYEAAGLTGDQGIRIEVSGRIQCMGSDHSLASRQVQTGSSMICVDQDESTRPLVLKDDNVFHLILKTHAAWSLKNLDFIRTISNAQAAKAYVYSHLTSQD